MQERTETMDAVAEGEPGGTAPRRARRPVVWWRRPWVLPLAVVCIGFLAFSVPPYLTLDPGQARIDIRDGVPVHYPAIVVHIAFGTVALLACCMQVWPWFRQRHPVAHRRIGRAYVFLGVLPAGLVGFVVSALHAQGVGAQLGNLLLNVLWIATTVAGFRAARQRRFGEHRKWMIRSFALCTSIVANRVWVSVTIPIADAQLATTYGGNEQAMLQTAIGTAVFLSWVVNLLIAEWWLQYRGSRRKARRRPVREAPAL